MTGDDNDAIPELEDPNDRVVGGAADGMDGDGGEDTSRGDENGEDETGEDEEHELSEEDNRKARDGTGF